MNISYETLISYAYFETERTIVNLKFFSKIGINESINILYVIIINGHNCSVELNNYKNCIILKRDNIGFDFGAHNYALNWLKNEYNDKLPFKYYIFLNCSVCGPFLPVYYPENLHWSNIFISRLNNRVKLVGTSIVCLPISEGNGEGPKVEGFCFATDNIGLNILIDKKTIFMDHPTKYSAIINGEYGMSNTIIEKGYTLDCLLYKYKNYDWTDKKNWNVNKNLHPSREGTYDGISIHPFEVVFHKWYWQYLPTVSFNFFEKYLHWTLN